ncbi:MAG: DUF4931 domain-containing protein [Patescibacteria group bacterium]
MKNISELRQDIVAGDWVVVATGRARRPNEFARHRVIERHQPRSSCPFEKLLPQALLVYDRSGKRLRLTPLEASRRRRLPRVPRGLLTGLTPQDRAYLQKNWWLQVVPNRYPAFGRGVCAVERKIGPYRWQDGVGFHEVVITRDHRRSIADMTVPEVQAILRSYRDRYLELKEEDCIQYISIFHNHGREAGATISHPHSQIIAIPVIPPDVARSIRGSAIYFGNNRTCVHCAVLRQERANGRRIVYRNRQFLAFCPFASRQAFEVRIFPLQHRSEFETASDAVISALADALRVVLAKLSRGLKRPAYNFFIHTAPVSSVGLARYYHWHIEILPKTAVWAGLEIGTGIEISTIAPESAAQFLRKIKV